MKTAGVAERHELDHRQVFYVRSSTGTSGMTVDMAIESLTAANTMSLNACSPEAYSRICRYERLSVMNGGRALNGATRPLAKKSRSLVALTPLQNRKVLVRAGRSASLRRVRTTGF